MKKKVLLISPNIKGIKDGINRIQPSLGMGYLAAVLLNGGYDVYVHDSALEGYNNKVLLDDNKTLLIGESDKQLANYISRIQPDIVGISVLFSNLAEHAHSIARIVKNINPETPVILGGNHISNAVIDYQYSLKHPNSNLDKAINDLEDDNIDYAMIGECDEAILDLVNALFNDNPNLHSVPGLIFKTDDGFHINPKPKPVDIKKLPFPARNLMNMEGYFKIGLFHSSKSSSNRIANIMTSRGCPEKCSFCTTPRMWGSLRWRDSQNIFEEIKLCVDKYNIQEIQFEDDSLTANINHLFALCDLLEPLKIPWCLPNGIKVNYYASKQNSIFKRMAKAGCYQVTLACESGVQRVLDDIIGKNLKVDEIKPAIQKARDAGLFVHTFWIVGFPGETWEEMEKTIEVAEKTNADSYSVAILSPLPGSPIYHQVMEKNLWWDNFKGTKELMYRNSLVRADGFGSPEEFENWVNGKNVYLNSLIEKNEPDRAKQRKEHLYNKDHIDLKMKQT